MNRRQRDARRRTQAEQERDSEGWWLDDNQVLPLRWRPSYLDQLDNIKGATWVWPVIQEACGLSDPAQFPTFEAAWTTDQAAMLARYVKMSERLIGTAVMNSGATVKINLISGDVTKSVPADDATAGFATFFRQFFKDGEEASFKKVADVIGRAAHEAGATETADALKAWRRAHDTLRKKHLRLLMHEIVVAEGLMPDGEEGDGGRRIGTAEEITPRELIEAYLYGDLIHWGHTHPKLKAWSETPRGEAEMEYEMRNDAHVLAHFYVAFAEVVRHFR